MQYPHHVDQSQYYQSHMIPAMFAPPLVSSSSSSSIGGLQPPLLPNDSSSSSASLHRSIAPPFDAPAYFAQTHMFGVVQEAEPVRRSLLVSYDESHHQQQQQFEANNPLLQSSHRAVQVQQRSSDESGWYQSHEASQQQQHKSGLKTTTIPLASYPMQQHSSKELMMPRVDSLFVSVPRSFVLPSMPEYIEATSFSCVATPMFELKSIWNQVRTNLEDDHSCFVAQETPYALTCAKSCSLTCTEFNVRCYSGHYASTPVDGSWMTVEFQRRSGCCVGVMATFRRIMRHVSTLVHVESKISMDEVRPAQDEELQQEEGYDMSDIDMNALAMPSLARSTDATQMMCGDASVYDSLMDMISSSSTDTQIEGMNALALCLDGTHPQSTELLLEVARKIEGADCFRVREAAAKVVAQASNIPSAAAAVVQHCLPLVIRSIMHASEKCGSTSAPLGAAFNAETKKHLLRSCVQLSSSVPHALDADGSAVASSKFRRELLNMSATGDDEVRGLAIKAMNAITV